MDEARIRAAIRDAEVTVELKAAKEQLKKQQVASKAAQATLQLTPEAPAYISDAVKAHVLKADEEFRRAQPDDDGLFEYESTPGQDYESTGKAPAREGWLYLAWVLDLYARKLVGWAMSETMPQELTLQALEVARGGAIRTAPSCTTRTADRNTRPMTTGKSSRRWASRYR